MEARRAKTGRSGVWFTTAVPAGPSQQVCGFKKSLEPSPCLAYSEVVSWFFRISLRIFPQTVRMSRHLKRYKLAGGLTVLGDHERVPLLEELHDPPESPPRLRCADHLHAEASHDEEGMDGVEGGQHPKPATPSSLTFQDGCRRRS